MKRLLPGLAGVTAAALALWVGLGGGQPSRPPVPHFSAEGYPAKLSDWGMVAATRDRLVLGENVVPYDLATPLFSDYAGKLRAIYVPKGAAAAYDAEKTFDFPVGTIISKTFYYPLPAGADRTGARVLAATGDVVQSGADGLDLSRVKLIETRILARRASGWVALPYVWNDTQTEATLMRTGTLLPLTLQLAGGGSEDIAYAVPNVNQCASCHTPDHASRQIAPIGPKARHLNKSFPYTDGAENQLAHWQRIGLLAGAPAPDAAPRNADFRDTTAPLAARARAYLDINCGHCHNAAGLARTTGLYLDAGVTDPRRLGTCKPPVAAGPGTGDHIFDIVPHRPDDSILPFRVAATRPGIRMPEVGRSVVHQEGVDLIRQWIASLPGDCGS
ncbi:MAG: SO2930 family diheme c-type cytochrome [Rhodospirillales bacterium]